MTSLYDSMDDRKNYILLMNLICSKYGLDPKVKTNLTNVRAFLINLDRHSIAERYTTLDESNQYIVDLYGETIKANTRDIVADLNYVKDYMVKQINTPGDEAKIA